MEKLARVAKGVLLLTATPIQLGQAGHFGRLRLLDPERFSNLEKYLAETQRYEEIASLANQLLSTNDVQPDVAEGLRRLFPDDAALHVHLENYRVGAAESREKLIADLVDRHGTGRMMFRNRRQALGGFPKRIVHAVPLEPNEEYLELVNALFPNPKNRLRRKAISRVF